MKMSKIGRIFRYTSAAAALLASGFFIGRLTLNSGAELPKKLIKIFGIVENEYVDNVSLDSLQEAVIPLFLSQLDPHSLYLPPEVNREETERLDGQISGIGVQFNTITDTVVVINVIPGGPSQRAGVLPGDRLLTANNKKLYGKGVTNDSIMGLLKGPGGSVVTLSVRREGKPMVLKIVRGDFPSPSLEASYEPRNGVLYLRFDKWARTTHGEFLSALAKFPKAKAVIFDLRDNGGGILEPATALCNEFLQKNQSILYAEGRNFLREDIVADGNGLLKDIPMVVLVNELTASSSEIFAGAMQDHDRALIMGRRTFGKGLVQHPFELKDGSVVRLTVARYYTPSGRCIQKPYRRGDNIDYRMDLENRYLHGELYSADSMILDKHKAYRTDGGRIVYGGGGIAPDVFVPLDTAGMNPYFQRLAHSGMIERFAFVYADRYRPRLSKFKTSAEFIAYLDKQVLLYKIADYASQNGIPIRPASLRDCAPLLLKNLYAAIVANFLGRTAFYEIYNMDDPMLAEALRVIAEGKAFPLKRNEKIGSAPDSSTNRAR